MELEESVANYTNGRLHGGHLERGVRVLPDEEPVAGSFWEQNVTRKGGNKAGASGTVAWRGH